MRAAQVKIANTATRDALELWPLVNPMNPQDSFGVWLSQMLALLERTRRASVEAAQVSYNDLRSDFVADAMPVKLPVPDLTASPRAVAALLATGPGRMRHLLKAGYPPSLAHKDAFPQLAGVVTKQSLDAGREAVDEALRSDEDAIGWARITRPKACAWCRMLASRGAVYSKTTVTKVVGSKRSGTRKIGDDYHDDCRCIAVPVFDHDQQLPDASKQHADDWTRSTVGLSGTEALAAFRAYTGAH